MRPALFFKIVLMIASLTAVVYAIRILNSQNMEHALTSIGIEAGGAGAPGFQAGGRAVQQGEERFGICSTRITGFDFPGGRKIEEEKQGMKLKWMALDPKPREIGTIEVEKWLSRHCQVVVREVAASEIKAGASESEVVLHYVDGRQASIARIGEDLFRLEGKIYRSDDLASALKELAEIAQFSSPANP